MPKVVPFARYWAPVITWILLIFWGSGNVMSAEHTSRFIMPFLVWLMPDASTETLLLMHLAIRKGAHLTEYAILAILLFRAALRGANLRLARSTLLVWVWIACVVVATGDEFRQSFAEARGPSPWDVMIDVGGSIFGLLICSRWIGSKSRNLVISNSKSSAP